MAVLASCATGNLTSASTWALIDSTSYLNAETGSEVLTTAYAGTRSSTFTPGAITIDGIGVKLSVRTGTTGTISVELVTGGVGVAGTEVTINCSDLPAATTAEADGGWVFFKFSAPVLLIAATAYSVEAKTSNASQVSLFRDGTTDNISRFLRTTTTQAPIVGDDMIIVGEKTGAGTSNSFVVTMNSTASTDYGSASTSTVTPALAICNGGTLRYGTSATTDYILRISGNAINYSGGVFNEGEVATPIPRGSTGWLEFDCAADGDFGFICRNGSTTTLQFLSRTSGKDIIACKLNTDEAVGQTTLGVDTDTGWLSGDEIAIAKTNRNNANEVESKILNGNAGASSFDITVSTSFSHSGTSPTQADIILLTRSGGVRSVTSTSPTFVAISATASFDADWARFRYIGDTAAGKRGIVIATTTGSCSIQYCSITDTEEYGLHISGSATNNIVFKYNTCYSLNTSQTSGLPFFLIDATSGTTGIDVSYNYFFDYRNGTANDMCCRLSDVGFTFSHNTINCGLNGTALFFDQSGGVLGDFSYNTVYGLRTQRATNQNSGVPIGGGELNNFTSWNNNSSGFGLLQGSGNLTINDMTLRGNLTDNVSLGGGHANLTFNRLVCSANGNATTSGINFSTNAAMSGVVFNDCSFGIASGTYTAHTNDILCTDTHIEALFNNCLFGSATRVSSYTSLKASSILKFHRLNQTANNHIWYTKYGTAQSTGAALSDTTVRTSGSLAVRIAPEDSTTGFSWTFKILARANSAIFINGFLKKNAAFGSDTALVELFLPGSTVADSSQTLSNDTSWNVFSLSANYTGTENLYATVKVTAKSTTSAAYIYIDDLYNGTNTITALDVWNEGRPSDIMFEQLGDASAVWAVATSSLTAAGTTGYLLRKLLTLAQFLGLS